MAFMMDWVGKISYNDTDYSGFSRLDCHASCYRILIFWISGFLNL